MYTDSHNHTCHFSPDAAMSIDELISSAREKDISTLAITEHYEIDYPHKDDSLSLLFDIDNYVKTFDEWKTTANASNVKLLMGIELGYQPHIVEEIEAISSKYRFDTVILSNHLFRDSDVYFSKSAYSIPREQRTQEYIGVMARMAMECNNYDIIAHYDYINRYSINNSDYVFYSDAPIQFDELFEAIISKNKALEINTSSINAHIKKGSKHIMPDPEIIKRYVAMGGKLISLGSDSHKPETLGFYFDETANYLKSLGVNEICHFVKHKPVFETIN